MPRQGMPSLLLFSSLLTSLFFSSFFSFFFRLFYGTCEYVSMLHATCCILHIPWGRQRFITSISSAGGRCRRAYRAGDFIFLSPFTCATSSPALGTPWNLSMVCKSNFFLLGSVLFLGSVPLSLASTRFHYRKPIRKKKKITNDRQYRLARKPVLGGIARHLLVRLFFFN